MSKWGIASRAASLLIVLVATGFAIWDAGLRGGALFLICLLPLALIWFPETMGSLGNVYDTGQIRRIIPPGLVAFMGWFLLIGLPLLIVFLVGWKNL